MNLHLFISSPVLKPFPLLPDVVAPWPWLLSTFLGWMDKEGPLVSELVPALCFRVLGLGWV